MLFWVSRASLVAAGSMAAVGSFFSPRRIRRFVNGAVAVLSTSIVFLDQGTRSLTALLVLPPALVWMLRSRSRVARKIWLVGPVLGFALLTITQLQMYLRTEYSRSELHAKSFGEILELKQHNDFFT